MAKFTDAKVVTLQNFFDSGDQPTSAQFDELILAIQEGIEETLLDGTGDGDSSVSQTGILMADDAWIGIGAALERIVFDAAGDIAVMGANFGIGTDTPKNTLEIWVGGGGIAAIGLATTNSYLNFNLYYSAGWKYISTDEGGQFQFSSTGNLQYNTAPSGTAGNAASLTNRFTILNTGNVGIGETNPSALLEVDGEIKYHSLTDITCANFKEYSDEELLSMIDLQPRKDGILHKSTPTSKAFPHIDFSKVHPDIAAIAKTDKHVTSVYSRNGKGKTEKASTDYKQGDQYGVDFGSFVYALAECVVRQAARIDQLETK